MPFVKLTQFTDYSLRILIVLAAHPDRWVSTTEIAETFRISVHHAAKAAKHLTSEGYLHTRRGKAGGLQLARPPQDIRLGALVRLLEDPTLLECFDPATNTCRILPVCHLRGILGEAQRAFFDVLDRYTLADLVANHDALRDALNV